MKQVREARLFFKEGKSDKVYEVDLCQLDSDQFVVNFRYGRRASTLREGTKTVFPVSLAEANKTFDALVTSKTKKGYQEEGTMVKQPVTSIANGIKRNVERDEAVLSYLAKGDSHDPSHWPISRAIWRAGELNLSQGADKIVGYLNSSDEMEVYASIWALGKMESGKGIDSLKSKITSWSNKDKRHRLACAYILKFGDESSKQSVVGSMMSEWPGELIEAINNKKIPEFESLLNGYKANGGQHFSALLTDLYLLSLYKPWIKPFIVNVLKAIEFKPNYFKAVRYIFKLSEFLTDYTVVSLLGKRFYFSHPYFNKGWGYTWLDGDNVEVEKELKKENSRLAYSGNTNLYLKNRVLRHLKRSVDFSDQNYISLAKTILLTANEEADYLSARKERVFEYDYSIWQEIDKGVRYYPAYASYSALMYVVYGNSQRYRSNKIGTWYIQDENTAASFEDIGREEAHPYLWDNAPKEVIEVLLKSVSLVVSDFAVRVFKANESFKQEVNTEVVLGFLSHKHIGTSLLGIDLAKAILNRGDKSPELVFALLACQVEAGEELGLQYFDSVKNDFESNGDFIVKVVQSGNAFLLNTFSKKIEESALNLNNIEAFRLVHINIFLNSPENYTSTYLEALVKALSVKGFGKLFAELKPSEIQLFIESKDENLIMFGLALIGVNNLPSYELAGEFILDMVNSEMLVVQTSAIKLLADFPEAYFSDKQDLVVSLALSELEEVRNATVPVLLKLINGDASFKARVYDQLIIALCNKEKNEGFHLGCKAFLETNFEGDLKSLSKENVFSLISAPFEVAQQLGEALFFDSFRISELSNSELVEMSNADPKKIRVEITQYVERSVAKVKNDLESFLGLLESKWEDVRLWSFEFFTNSIDERLWELEYIMKVCDSPLLDVQAFGRKLITKVFNSEYGLSLLLKLSEHPTDEMKLFTTNYLAQFASGKTEVIKQLKPYFLSVLLSVNKNAIAKKRVVQFLTTEAHNSEEVGRFTLELIEGLLLSNTLSDKSNYLTLLIELKDKYQGLEMPFEVVPTKVYTHEV